MTAEQLARRIEELVAAARESGLENEMIADTLQDAVDVLHEGLS